MSSASLRLFCFGVILFPENKKMGGKGSGHPNPSPSTRFKPGKSGNEGGAPKGKRLSTWIMELLQITPAQLDALDKSDLPNAAVIAHARILKAMDFDHGEQSTEIILERTEGKVVQPVSVENKDPIPHKTAEEAAQAILNIGKQK